MARDVESRKSNGLRLLDGVALVVVAVVGVVVGFWLLGHIVAFVWEVVKVVVILALVAGVLWYLMGRRRRS